MNPAVRVTVSAEVRRELGLGENEAAVDHYARVMKTSDCGGVVTADVLILALLAYASRVPRPLSRAMLRGIEVRFVTGRIR